MTTSKTSSTPSGSHALAVTPSPESTVLDPVTGTVSHVGHAVHPIYPASAHDRHHARAARAVPPAMLWSSPWHRTSKLHTMMTQLVTRAMGNHAGLTALTPHGLSVHAIDDLMAMQQAVVRRLQQQQQDWLTGVQSIAHEYSELQAANTLSKFVGQEYNVVAQMGALVNRQWASFVGLVENVQVDCAYWVSQKHAEQAPPAPLHP